MKKEELLIRVDHMISLGKQVISTQYHVEMMGDYVDHGKQIGFRTASLSFIKNLFGEKSPYFINFNERVNGHGLYEAEIGINILQSIRNEIDNDWLLSVKDIISAEVFTDFLEMGKYLLDNGYKDAAAVIIGSVLEEHLRSLCRSNSIDIVVKKDDLDVPKKAEVMNTDLRNIEVYGVLDQKNVTAWLDLRNKAAHGKYSEYSKEHVDIMYLGVLTFISKYK